MVDPAPEHLDAAARVDGARPRDLLRVQPVALQDRAEGRRVSPPATDGGAVPTRDTPACWKLPAHRLAAVRRSVHRGCWRLSPADVVLSTHINADGDGCGSEAGFARLLARAGLACRIVNPTPWPGLFDFLLGIGRRRSDRAWRGRAGGRRRDGGARHRRRPAARGAGRCGAGAHDSQARDRPPRAGRRATGTDQCSRTRPHARPGSWCSISRSRPGGRSRREAATALYTALLTDTGGFRFSNTSPRCHAIAGYLLSLGIDPEEMYRRVYASVPLGRLHLLRDALATLEVDPEYGDLRGSPCRRARWSVTGSSPRTSMASSSTRARSRGRGWRSSSATSATAR